MATVLTRDALTRRISLPITDIDLTIDRRYLLAELFSKVSSGYTSQESQVLAWVRYLQDRLAHPKTAPLHDNGQAIYDPLWILLNRVAHCGQTNRVLVDGLSAAGFEARVVQLKAHVAAEVWIDRAWRFLDADWLNLGQLVRRPDGTLPSAEEIHANPSLLDSVKPDLEFRLYPSESVDEMPPYEDMFATKPYYYVKTATMKQERNAYYGWNFYKTVRQ